MPPLLLFLCLFPAPILSATRFVLSGHVTCHCGRPFKYGFLVVEVDPSKKEYLYNDTFFSNTSPAFYNMSCSDTTDGFLNFYYELAFRVDHTCNAEGKRMFFWMDVGEYKITHGTHYITVPTIDVTNRGEDFMSE